MGDSDRNGFNRLIVVLQSRKPPGFNEEVGPR